jgi:hypothetical protein
MFNLSISLFNQNKFFEAEKYDAECLEIRKRILNPDHPHIAESMQNLAISLLNQN